MLVASLVIVVALAVLQLVLAAHVRATLTACASEGARVAAVARQGDDAGLARAVGCARDSLGMTAAATAGDEDVAGLAGVRVTLTGPSPVLVLWHGGDVSASGRAIREVAGA